MVEVAFAGHILAQTQTNISFLQIHGYLSFVDSMTILEQLNKAFMSGAHAVTTSVALVAPATTTSPSPTNGTIALPLPTLPISPIGVEVPTLPLGTTSPPLPTMPISPIDAEVPTLPLGTTSRPLPTVPISPIGAVVPILPQDVISPPPPTVPISSTAVPTLPRRPSTHTSPNRDTVVDAVLQQPTIPTTASRDTRIQNAPRLPTRSTFIELAKAKWPYNEDGTDPNDLSFSADEIIEIISESDENWWTGRVRGRQGLFPSDYVEKLQLQPKANTTTRPYKPGANNYGSDIPPVTKDIGMTNSIGLQEAPGQEQKKINWAGYLNTAVRSAVLLENLNRMVAGSGSGIGGGSGSSFDMISSFLLLRCTKGLM